VNKLFILINFLPIFRSACEATFVIIRHW